MPVPFGFVRRVAVLKIDVVIWSEAFLFFLLFLCDSYWDVASAAEFVAVGVADFGSDLFVVDANFAAAVAVV